MLKQKIKKELEKNSFLRAITVLVGGTAAAHAITAIAMLFLSRMYSPADFGTLAVLTAVVSTVSVAACLRYDIAVALPHENNDSLALLVISVSTAAIISTVAYALLHMITQPIVNLISVPALLEVNWLIPVGVFASAVWSSLQSWHIRQRSYNIIAKARMGQSLAMSAAQIMAALMGIGTIGLLIGPLVGFAVSAITLYIYGHERISSLKKDVSREGIKRNLIQYKNYPVYSTWEALSNQAGIQLPIVVIAAAASTTEAGSLALAILVLQAPMGILGAAIGQVYLSNAPEENKKGRLAEYTLEIAKKLSKVGVAPLIGIGILSPILFPLIFGANWERAGWLVSWMTPWFILQFIVSPISMALHVNGEQRSAMFLQIVALITRLGMALIGALYFDKWIAEIYAVSGIIVYLMYLVAIYHLVIRRV